MNKYAVFIYDDTKGANPHKMSFDYMATSKEEAREKGEKFAEIIFPYGKISVSVEFRK